MLKQRHEPQTSITKWQANGQQDKIGEKQIGLGLYLDVLQFHVDLIQTRNFHSRNDVPLRRIPIERRQESRRESGRRRQKNHWME